MNWPVAFLTAAVVFLGAMVAALIYLDENPPTIPLPEAAPVPAEYRQPYTVSGTVGDQNMVYFPKELNIDKRAGVDVWVNSGAHNCSLRVSQYVNPRYVSAVAMFSPPDTSVEGPVVSFANDFIDGKVAVSIDWNWELYDYDARNYPDGYLSREITFGEAGWYRVLVSVGGEHDDDWSVDCNPV